ncbi:MAG: hypothetical protein ACRDOO_26205 [Actinomadura sp.]
MARTLMGSIRDVLTGNRLPAGVRPALALGRGERVLAHAPTRGGSHVVATSAALYVPVPRAPDEEGHTALLRLPWERIEHAAWRDGWLHVHESDREAEHHLRLTEPGSVPEAVRERITSTVVVDHPARLPGGGRVRITGRRTAEGDELRWAFVFEAGLDPADPGLRAQAEQLLEELRRQTGL